MRTPTKPPIAKTKSVSASPIALVLVLVLALAVTCSCAVSAFSFSNHVSSHTKSAGAFGLSRGRFSGNACTTETTCIVQGQHRRERRQLVRTNAYGGHDYELEPSSEPDPTEACRFTEDQIRQLIAKRLECKKRRNFDDADRILEALNQSGIYVQDKARKYRVDGQNHFGRRPRYVQRGGSYGLSSTPEDLALVAELVEERARFKRLREYHRSDDITQVLKDKYGVRVNDRKREWSVENGGSAGNQDETADKEYYVPTPLARDDHPTHTMSEETKDLIRDRLRDRTTARKKKNYKEADRIRDELMEEYSILIDDRTKEWKVMDGVFDADGDDPFVREAQLSQRSAFVQGATFFERKAAFDDRDFDTGPGVKHDSFENALSQALLDDGDTTTTPPSAPVTEAEAPATETTIEAETAADVVDAEEESPAEETTTSETLDDLSELTVVALKEKLREAGLPVSGRKSELVDRLLSQ